MTKDQGLKLSSTGLSVLMNVQHRTSLRSTSYAEQAIQHRMIKGRQNECPMEDTPPASYLGWADMESAPTGGIEGNERPISNDEWKTKRISNINR